MSQFESVFDLQALQDVHGPFEQLYRDDVRLSSSTSTPPSALKRMSGHFLGASKEMEQKISRSMSSASITMSFLTGKHRTSIPRMAAACARASDACAANFHRPRLAPFADRHERLDDGASRPGVPGLGRLHSASAQTSKRGTGTPPSLSSVRESFSRRRDKCDLHQRAMRSLIFARKP